CRFAQVSLLISIELLNIPSPTTLLPFRDARFSSLRFLTVVAAARSLRLLAATRSWATSGTIVRSEVRDLLARSPTGLAESSSLSLRTVHSPTVAPHLFC
ncbi:MAG: hypothetical protein ACK5N9_09580, partial [Pirellula sp.]